MKTRTTRSNAAPRGVSEPDDPTARMRLVQSYPTNGGFWLGTMLWIALPTLVLFRSQLGERIVSPFRLVPVALLMAVWFLTVGAIACSSDDAAYLRSVAIGGWLVIGFLALGVGKRLARWWMWQKGEQVVRFSLGLSSFFKGLPNGNSERYLDPLASIGLGVVLCSPIATRDLLAAGLAFVFSGLAVLVMEKYMHERRQVNRDAIMAGKEHDLATQAYMQGLGMKSGREELVSTHVSTELDPALVSAIKRRQQSEATTALELHPAPTLPTSHGSADEGAHTVSNPSQHVPGWAVTLLAVCAVGAVLFLGSGGARRSAETRADAQQAAPVTLDRSPLALQGTDAAPLSTADPVTFIGKLSPPPTASPLPANATPPQFPRAEEGSGSSAVQPMKLGPASAQAVSAALPHPLESVPIDPLPYPEERWREVSARIRGLSQAERAKVLDSLSYTEMLALSRMVTNFRPDYMPAIPPVQVVEEFFSELAGGAGPLAQQIVDDPYTPSHMYLLGVFFESYGHYPAAIACYRRAQRAGSRFAGEALQRATQMQELLAIGKQ